MGEQASIVAAALVCGAFIVGCQQGAREHPCGCDAATASAQAHLACGESECVGGVPFTCSSDATLIHMPGSCGAPPPHPRPAGTPDLVIVAVSGHCFPGCSFNEEYLTAEGTTLAIAHAFDGLGLNIESISTTDNFYDYPVGSATPAAFGFLSLLAALDEANNTLVADWDNPTRFILVAHSHGAVWAHLALHVLEQRGRPLPVDVLIDIDGISISWENDAETGLIGDEWASVIEAYHGMTWPFPIDHPTDAFTIPGVSTLQDIEDIVPNSAVANLEIWSNDGLGVRDTQHNHRLDGSQRNIAWFQSTTNHENSDAPTSDGVTWAVQEIRIAYGL